MGQLVDLETQKALIELLNEGFRLVIALVSMWLIQRNLKSRKDIRAAHDKIRTIEKSGAPGAVITTTGADGTRVEADVGDAVRVEVTLRLLPAPTPPKQSDDEKKPDAAA